MVGRGLSFFKEIESLILEILFFFFTGSFLSILGECQNGTDAEKRSIMDEIFHPANGRELVCVYVVSDVDTNPAALYKIFGGIRP
jgi:hypothetical protein